MLDFETDIEVVGEAANGDEVISMTDTLRPDVVLLDLNMPEKNGLDALTAIQDRHPEVKVLVLTGLDAGRLREITDELGAVEYVLKGTSMSQVAEHMRVAVGTE